MKTNTTTKNPYEAGAYDVTELRTKYSTPRSSRLVAASLAVALLGAGAVGYETVKEEYRVQRRRFVQRLIAEELGKNPIDAGLSEKQLRMRLLQERARTEELTERIVAIAHAVEIEE